MSAFSDDCREKAARYAERAAAYRMAGETMLAAACRTIAINLSQAAENIDLLDQVGTTRGDPWRDRRGYCNSCRRLMCVCDVAERLQA